MLIMQRSLEKLRGARKSFELFAQKDRCAARCSVVA